MPIAGAPVSLTPGETVTLSSPIHPGVQNSWQVELDNLSPWTVIAHVSGRTYPIGPSVMRLFTIGSGPADVSIDVPAGGSGGPYQLYSTWAQNPDHIEGTFPSSVGLTSISTGVVDATINGPVTIEGINGGVEVGIAQFPTSLGTQTWTPSSTTMNFTGIPATTRSLLITGTSGPYIFTVTGSSSGLKYTSDVGINVVSPALSYLIVPIVPGLDSSVSIEVTAWGTGVNSGTMGIVALPEVIPTPLPASVQQVLTNQNSTGSSAVTVYGPATSGPYIIQSASVSMFLGVTNSATQGYLAYGASSYATTFASFYADGGSPASLLIDLRNAIGTYNPSATNPSGFQLTCNANLAAIATITYVDLS